MKSILINVQTLSWKDVDHGLDLFCEAIGHASVFFQLYVFVIFVAHRWLHKYLVTVSRP